MISIGGGEEELPEEPIAEEPAGDPVDLAAQALCKALGVDPSRSAAVAAALEEWLAATDEAAELAMGPEQPTLDMESADF